MTGTVTTIKFESGYGFLRDEDGHDRFFHANDVQAEDPLDLAACRQTWQELEPGDRVTFEPVTHRGGRRAECVRRKR